jgi:hypothetical protein
MSKSSALRVAIMVTALVATVPSAWSIALRGHAADAERRVIESVPMARGWLRMRGRVGARSDRLAELVRAQGRRIRAERSFLVRTARRKVVDHREGGPHRFVGDRGARRSRPWRFGPADCSVLELDEKDSGASPRFGTATTELRIDYAIIYWRDHGLW